jgi:hypothetical protein
MNTQKLTRRLGRSALRISLAAIAVALAAALIPSQALAATPSVAITSPTDGDVLSMYADWTTPTVAEAPLVVTFVADGSPVTCALDKQEPVPCTSPASFEHVVAGGHSVTVSAGSASQTTNVTVQTVALAPPPVVDGPYFRPVTVKALWKVGPRRTWVRRVELRNMPRHVRVQVSCRGAGCPSPYRIPRRASGRVDLTTFLRGHGLRPGTRISIRVSKAGHRIQTFNYTIRSSARPSLVVT